MSRFFRVTLCSKRRNFRELIVLFSQFIENSSKSVESTGKK